MVRLTQVEDLHVIVYASRYDVVRIVCFPSEEIDFVLKEVRCVAIARHSLVFRKFHQTEGVVARIISKIC
jgi:hypothetical protein